MAKAAVHGMHAIPKSTIAAATPADLAAGVFLRAYCQVTITRVTTAINPIAKVERIQSRAPQSLTSAHDAGKDHKTTAAARIKIAKNKWTKFLVSTESAATGSTKTA